MLYTYAAKILPLRFSTWLSIFPSPAQLQLYSLSGSEFNQLTFTSSVHEYNVAVMQRKAKLAEVLRGDTLHKDRSRKSCSDSSKLSQLNQTAERHEHDKRKRQTGCTYR